MISNVGHFPFGGDCIEGFRTYNIGPALAYNVTKEEHRWNATVKSIISSLPDTDTVLFSFGQIDSASHFPKQAQLQDRPIEDVALDAAHDYFNFIVEISQTYNKQVIIYGPVTAGNMEIADFLFKEKLLGAKIFTEYLQDRCKDVDGIEILPLYELLVDDEDTDKIKSEYFYDKTHLNTKILPRILEKINKQLCHLRN